MYQVKQQKKQQQIIKDYKIALLKLETRQSRNLEQEQQFLLRQQGVSRSIKT